MIAERKLTLRAAGFSAFCVFLLYSFPLWRGLYYFGRDFTVLGLSGACAYNSHDAAGGGWLTPFVGDGSPIIGLPAYLALHPYRWLMSALTFSPDAQASLWMIFHLGIGAAATTWLLRTYGLRPFLAAAGGVAFALTGPAMDLFTKDILFAVAVSSPPLAWAATRNFHLQGSTVLSLLGIAGAIFSAFLGGDPQTAGVSLALVIFTVIEFRKRPNLKLSATLMGALLMGVAIWIPAIAEGILGPRSGTLNLEEALTWSFETPHWLGAIFPGILVEPFFEGQSLETILRPPPLHTVSWNATPHIGILIFALLFASVAIQKARAPFLIFVISLLASLGKMTPFLGIVMTLFPPAALFRYPAKYLVVTSLAAVVCAFLVLSEHKSRRVLVIVFSACLVVGCAAVVTQKALIACGFLIVALLLVWKRKASWLAALVCVELIFGTLPLLQYGPPLANVSSLVKDRIDEKNAYPHMVPSICVDPLAETYAEATSPTTINRDLRILILRPELQACDELTSAIPYAPLFITRMHDPLAGALQAGRADVARSLGCAYYLTSHVLTEDVIPIDEFPYNGARGVRLYKIVNPMPPVFALEGKNFVEDEARVLEKMRSGVSNPLDDPRGILMGELATQMPDSMSLDWPRRDTLDAKISGGPALLVFRTRYLRGWRAFQGEKELPTLRINGQQLAVSIEKPDSGKVMLRYSPPKGLASIFLFLFGLMAILFALRRSGT